MYTIDIDNACTPCAVRLAGELTIYHAVELRRALLPLLLEHHHLDLDLAGVTELDSAGVQVLMVSRREAVKGGGALRILGRSNAVDEVFGAMNIAAGFDGVPADATPSPATH